MPPITYLAPSHGFLDLAIREKTLTAASRTNFSRPGHIFNSPRGPALDGIPLSDLGIQPPDD